MASTSAGSAGTGQPLSSTITGSANSQRAWRAIAAAGWAAAHGAGSQSSVSRRTAWLPARSRPRTVSMCPAASAGTARRTSSSCRPAAASCWTGPSCRNPASSACSRARNWTIIASRSSDREGAGPGKAPGGAEPGPPAGAAAGPGRAGPGRAPGGAEPGPPAGAAAGPGACAARASTPATALVKSASSNGLPRTATPAGRLPGLAPVMIRHRLGAAGSARVSSATRSTPSSSPRRASTTTASYPPGYSARASASVPAVSTRYPLARRARLVIARSAGKSSTTSTRGPVPAVGRVIGPPTRDALTRLTRHRLLEVINR
jgi:hypothetical protein